MKHLFFDLDHTLWDFDKNSEAALRILYADFNLGEHIRSFQTFHTTYKKVNTQLWRAYGKGQITKEDLRVKRFSKSLRKLEVKNPVLSEQLAEGYVHLSPLQKNLFPGTIEVLSSLKKDGFDLHIITNGFREIQEIKLRNTDIRDFFDVVLCSEEMGKQKPHPLVFHTALERAGAKKNESIMIGDNLHTDVMGASRSGIQAILFDPERVHRQGTHEWHIHQLAEIPGLIPWISKANQ